jgi:hypothetical protein
MTEAQHQLFNRFVQGASESRADLHDVAWVLMGALLLLGILALAVISVWLLQGGLSRYSSLASEAERKLIQEWLREP